MCLTRVAAGRRWTAPQRSEGVLQRELTYVWSTVLPVALTALFGTAADGLLKAAGLWSAVFDPVVDGQLLARRGLPLCPTL